MAFHNSNICYFKTILCFVSFHFHVFFFYISVSNLLEDSSTVRRVLNAHFPQFIATLATTLAECVSDDVITSEDNFTISNLPTMQACHVGAKICLQLCQYMGDKLQDILWTQGDSTDCCPSGGSCSDEEKVTQHFHQILQALLDMISNKVCLLKGTISDHQFQTSLFFPNLQIFFIFFAYSERTSL